MARAMVHQMVKIRKSPRCVRNILLAELEKVRFTEASTSLRAQGWIQEDPNRKRSEPKEFTSVAIQIGFDITENGRP